MCSPAFQQLFIYYIMSSLSKDRTARLNQEDKRKHGAWKAVCRILQLIFIL